MISASYVHKPSGIRFRTEWTGGAYADIKAVGGSGVPCDCLNLWDYEKGVPAIPVNDRPELKRRLIEWVRESADDYIKNGAI